MKMRGKSASIIVQQNESINNNNKNFKAMSPKKQQHIVPLSTPTASSSSSTTALLKIESVVPGRSRNFSKSIRRSYSTLSSEYFKKPYDKYNSNNNNNINNSSNKIDLIEAQKKSLISNTNNLITNTNNGFWHIQRNNKEKEKLPDRINLDKRGLTAIPIIDDEPNLRLLSLQHNLINSFYVPDIQNDKKTIINNIDITNNNVINNCNNINNNCNTTNSNINNRKSATSTNSNHHQNQVQLKRQISIQKSSSSRNFSQTINKSSSATMNNNLNSQHQQNQTNNNNTIMKNSFIQKSILLHAKEKYVFKKSNSFINTYSQQLASSKIHLNRLIQQNNNNRYSNNDILSSINQLNGLQHQPQLTTVSTNYSIISNNVDDLMIKNEKTYLNISNSLQNLVFLDLYDNQIEKISNLDGLKNLTVLLLGKNRIIDISGIISVKNTLRVLDLHGNKIVNITNKINQLQELKSLNLAGNNLKQIYVDDFKTLFNLKELNLKRNKIKKIIGFNDLRNLERLWLCHNDLQKVDDMLDIAKAINLKEITIENNPVSLAGDCVSFLVSYLPTLVLLSQMTVTEQVRRAAMAWRKNKELSSDFNFSHLTNNLTYNQRREEVISNARTNWELLRSQQQQQQQQHNQQQSLPQQCNNTTNIVQKSVRNPSHKLQQQIPLSEIDIELISNLSDNIHVDKKLIKQKTMTTIHTNNNDNNNNNINNDNNNNSYIKSRKINRSSSQDNNQTQKIIINSTDIDLFRLPPILAPFFEQTINNNNNEIINAATKNYNINDNIKNNSINLDNIILNNLENDFINDCLNDNISPGSSLGPNVDSSSISCISSDNEDCYYNNNNNNKSKNLNLIDLKKVNEICDNTTPIKQIEIMKNENNQSDIDKIPEDESNNNNNSIKRNEENDFSIILAQEKLTDDNLSDKTSNLSTNSNKTVSSNQSITTNSSSNDNIIINNNNNKDNRNKDNNNNNNDNNSHNNNNNNNNIVNNNNNNVKTSSNKCKSAMPNKKLHSSTIVGNDRATLIRAQTAKNSQTILPSSSSTLVQATSTISTIPLNSAINQQQSNGTMTRNVKTLTAASTTGSISINNEREREQGGDYLIEICGRYLNVYGTGAIKFIDRQWNIQKANDVHTIKFNYVNFNNIIIILNRIKIRFPNAENLIFRETNINYLGQLNALAEVQGINSLIIDPEGNLICLKNWRPYAIYRLSHWGLKILNGSEITEEEIQLAQKTYTGLSELVLWSLPDTLLEPLLARLRLDESYSASKMTPKQWLMQADSSLKLVVGKEALQCNRKSSNQFCQQQSQQPQQQQQPDENVLRQKGKTYFSIMMENTCNAVEKLQKLETLWPNLLIEMIRNTLLDYSQIDVYVKNLLSDILKQ